MTHQVTRVKQLRFVRNAVAVTERVGHQSEQRREVSGEMILVRSIATDVRLRLCPGAIEHRQACARAQVSAENGAPARAGRVAGAGSFAITPGGADGVDAHPTSVSRRTPAAGRTRIDSSETTREPALRLHAQSAAIAAAMNGSFPLT